MSTLNLTNPNDRLSALVRLRGDVNAPCWLWFSGTVYARPEDDVVKPLIGFCSVLHMIYEPKSNGSYTFTQRESCLFTHLQTGEILTEMKNPYTGKSNYIFGYVSPVFKFGFDINGTFALKDQRDHTPLRESILNPALEHGAGDVWSTETRRNEFATAPSKAEFPEASSDQTRKSADIATYRAREDILCDLDTPFVPAQLTFLADTPWFQWMFMGNRPGMLVWSGAGAKIPVSSELPDIVRHRIDLAHPGFLDDPMGMDGTSFGTIVQMRQLKAEGKL